MRRQNCFASFPSRGFSVVEIMVGLVVGLVSMLVIMQMFMAFDRQSRTTATGDDAQTNGALALHLIEREVRVAGTSMTEGVPQVFPPLAGCRTNIYDTSAYLVPNPTAPFVSTVRPGGSVSPVMLAPVVISDGGGGASDAITLAYGTSIIAAPYQLTDTFGAASLEVKLSTGSGIGVNGARDMVALVEQQSAVSKNYIIPKPCALRQVNCPATGCGKTIPVPVGRYNKPDDGTGSVNFSGGGAVLYNLGQLNLVTYRVGNGDLVADISKFGAIPDGTATPTPVTNRTDLTPIAADIVNLQAQYGVDISNPMGTVQASCRAGETSIGLTAADADSIVDQWVDATGARWANNPGAGTPSTLDLRRVRAVRIGLVARSAVRAKGTDDEPCDTGPVTIRWEAGPAMTPDLSNVPNWQCYKYKVFQATIPVRNALWSSSMNPASAASCGLRDAS